MKMRIKGPFFDERLILRLVMYGIIPYNNAEEVLLCQLLRNNAAWI